MSEQPSTFSRLVEARVIQSLAIYIPVGWVLTEIATAATENFGLAPWVPGLAMTLLIAGAPVVAFLSWAFQITDQGVRTQVRSLKGGIAITIAVSLLLGLGVTLFQRLQVKPELEASGAPVEVAEPSEIEQAGPPMVGVLPFSFVAAQADASFFAAGVHDDLLTQLARLSGMRVISRTSVMQYANTTKAIPDIGKELGADAILEGGIQMYGSQIRINAQLIDAETDEHLWAETFDRELTPANLFEVQADIARAIAGAMQATLTTSESSRLDVMPTTNMAAYRAYHEAMTVVYSVALDREKVKKLLRTAIELDPGFVRAKAELVGLLSLQNFRDQDADEIKEVEGMIESIRRVAPDSPDYLVAQSYYTYYILRDYGLADRLITRARNLSPSDPRLVEIQTWIKRRRGDLEAYVELTRTAIALEPTNPLWREMLAGRLMLMHRTDEALAVARSIDNPKPTVLELIALLEMSGHKSLARYRDDLERIYAGLDPSSEAARNLSFAVWEARYTVGDKAAAAEIVRRVEGDLARGMNNVMNEEFELFVLHNVLEENGDQLRAIKSMIGLEAGSDAEGLESMHVIPRLMFHFASKNEVEARATILELRRAMREDLAMQLNAWDLLCSALAMSGQATETVDCLEEAMSRPSTVFIFLEPLLPYYDRIRDTPEFRAFLENLEENGLIASASRGV